MDIDQFNTNKTSYLTIYLRNVVAGESPPTFPPTINRGDFPTDIDGLAYITAEVAQKAAELGNSVWIAASAAWRVKIPPAALVTVAATFAAAVECTSKPAPARPARWVADEFARAHAAGDGPWQTPSVWFDRYGNHARWWKISAVDAAVGAALRTAIARAPSGSPAAADILSVFAADAARDAAPAHRSPSAVSAANLASGFARLMLDYHGGALAARLHERGGSIDALAAAAAALALN